MEDEGSERKESSSEEENSQERIETAPTEVAVKPEEDNQSDHEESTPINLPTNLNDELEKRADEAAEQLKALSVGEEAESAEKEPVLTIKKYMVVDLGETFSTEESMTYDELGFAVWLNTPGGAAAPALACSISAAAHPEWCVHKCYVWIMMPQSTKPITWKEEEKLNVSCCLKSLVVNPYNRDMFAAGTILGDIFIWTFDPKKEHERVTLLFTGHSEAGVVMAMDFYQLSPLTDDYVLLTCHDDGSVVSWKVGKIVVMDRKVRFYDADPEIDMPHVLTAICNSYGSNFFVGTLNGTILGPCSMSRAVTSSDGKYQDCVAETYAKQFYTILRLERIVYKGTEYILSSDYYSELQMFKLGNLDGTPFMVYRLPKLTDHYSLVCNEYVIIARKGGELRYFKLELGKGGGGTVENNLRGPPSCISMSRNQNWLVTGSYDGKFQVYSMDYQ